MVGTAKNPAIELIKFLAACEIVCFHLEAPWASYGRVLPIFLIFSISFTANSNLTGSAYLRKSVRRILHPWLFWSAVYLAAKVIRALITHSPVRGEFEWWMLFAGGTGLLWYLPYAFLSNAAIFYSIRRFHLKPAFLSSHIVAVSGGFVLLLAVMVLPWVGDFFPFSRWVYLAPAVIIGLVYSSYYYNFFRLIFARGVWILIVSCIGALAINLEVGLAYSIAVAVCSFAFSYRPVKSNRFCNYLGKISYGIYLSHYLISGVWQHLGVPKGSYPLLLLTVASSILLVAAIHKTALRRFV